MPPRANEKEEQWRRADERVRKNLPPGVKLVRTLRGHTDSIGRIAWSPDGRILASPSPDKTIRLWDAETGECLRTLKGHTNAVWCVAFDPTGATLASGGGDKTIKLWEAASGRLLRTFEGHRSSVWSFAFDPGGRHGVSASEDNTINLWEVANGRLFSTLKGTAISEESLHTISGVKCVAFDPAGRQVASGSGDNTVKLWEVASGRLLRTLESHQGTVRSVAFDPAGWQVASGSGDNTVKLWEVASGRLLRTLEGHTGEVRGVGFSPDGKCLASKSRDGSIRLWRADSGDSIATFPEPASEYWPPGLAFHPHRPLLATAGSEPGTEGAFDSVIHLYELNLGLLLGQPSKPSVSYTSAKVVLVGDSGGGQNGPRLAAGARRI